MWGLHARLVELLRQNDSDVVRMSIVLLSRVFPYNGTTIETPLALQLADMLLPLFDNVRLAASSHGHWLLPAHCVPWAFSGLGPGEREAAHAEVFCSSFHTE